jgi:FKBP-type peptidyl-prolyl cis-trans isomerase (trigger factor)|tara:strand:- start:1036 stop:1380 length:345 start_codon:yes stop_codon:yes gene_type:complete
MNRLRKILRYTLVAFIIVFALNYVMADNVASQGNTVAVDYWLTVDGEQIDTSEGRGVFEFTLGAGQVIPGFDKTVTGMKVGEEKSVTLSGNDAYTAGPLAGKVLNFRIILREIK